MTKITTARVRKALPRIEPELENYLILLGRIHKDVSEDSLFQDTYKVFFQLRIEGKFHAEYFAYMEQNKKNKKLTFPEVLEYITKKTRKVHASFASKLLSMINPNMPVLDERVREAIGFKKPNWHPDSTKRIERSNAEYEKILKWYKNRFESGEAKEWIERFDEHFEHYPGAKDRISDVKKIDLILWKIRDE